MGRNAKTEYPRTEVIKVRASREHLDLLGDIQLASPGEPSGADVVSWALEEYARKHCKSKIKFIPDTRRKMITIEKRGRTITIGKTV